LPQRLAKILPNGIIAKIQFGPKENFRHRPAAQVAGAIYSVGMEDWLQAIPGAQEIFDWFGYWPSFHDAEILSIELNRIGPSRILVHTFAVTDEVNSKGSYVCAKHCIVTLLLEDLEGLDLVDFNQMNVLSSLRFQHENNTFILTLAPIFGVGGSIKAKSVRIELTAGIPEDSQYKNTEA
jgi:hypothetical protein